MNWDRRATSLLGRIMTFMDYDDVTVIGPKMVVWSERLARRAGRWMVYPSDIRGALYCLAYESKSAWPAMHGRWIQEEIGCTTKFF